MPNPKLILGAVVLFTLLCLVFIIGATSIKAQEIVINMKNMQEGDLLVDGVELKSPTKLDIHAIGAVLSHSEEMYAYAWIINYDTREPVWVLSDQDTKRYRGSKMIREYEGDITLPAGRYECYYFAGRHSSLGDINITINNFSDAVGWLERVIDDNDEDGRQYNSGNMSNLLFEIKATAGSFFKFNPVQKLQEEAIVDFSRPGDDYSERKGFTLKKDLALKINAVGEYSSSDRVFVDYGWITNADTRKKVWQMDKWNTSWTGGGRKNRGFVGEIALPAGNYLAYYVTDDSHSFGEWNTLPPYDPLHYGMVIYAQNEGDRKYVAPYEDTYSEPIIIQITQVGNNADRSEGLILKKETNLHIIALGEYSNSDEFVDYGWIENLDNNEKVWEMREDNTEHAGGTAKNRKFDGVITLPPGNYMIYYLSDDFHSYRNWNAAAPPDKEMWGITIYGAGKNFDPKSATVSNQIPSDSKVLVSLTGLGDDADVAKIFKLDTPQKIHIFALGEGKSGEMYDYGWIEDSHRNTVWEMTYRTTRPAGGAEKNRKVNISIFLDKGEYTAHFMTDDSHSFPDFNEAKPDMPQKWGITISKE
ncbi:MAG: hypothetical protein NTV06_01370 [candidate division Zixibacteria bacterium]|nr:hypothetical protein [candidate division Zixibacteria bacterium]